MFLVDTFTDTDGTLLAAHTPDTGGAWEALDYAVASQAPGNDFEIRANTGRSTGLDGGAASQAPTHRNTADPGADEYDVSCTMSFHNLAQAQRFHWIEVRTSPTGTTNTAVDRYLFFANSSSTQQWELYRSVGGTLTLLDSVAAALAGNVFDIRVEVRTTGITVFVDNVSTLSTTDTAITQRGRVAIGTSRGGDTSTHWVDDLNAVAVGGVPAEGNASFGIGFELSATGSRPSEGEAHFVIGFSLRAQSTVANIPDLSGAATVQALTGDAETGGLSGTAVTNGLTGSVS